MRNYDNYSDKSGKKWHKKFDSSVGGQVQGGATAAQDAEQSGDTAHKPHQTLDQQVYRQQQQQPNTGAKQKKKGKCYNCDKVGHWASECRSKCSQKVSSYVKSCDVIESPDSDQRQPEQNLNSLKIVSSASECSDVAECCIDTFATQVQTPLVTNPAMMTCVRLEGVCYADFECDTAASHSVISEKVFSELQQQLKKKLCVKQVNVAIRLADGTSSNKSSGVVQIAVEKAYAEPVLLSFFVISGPNCLLGRHTLEQLWPEQYRALRNVASMAATKMSSSSHQQVPVKKKEKLQPSSHQSVVQDSARQSSETPATVAAQTQLPEK